MAYRVVPHDSSAPRAELIYHLVVAVERAGGGVLTKNRFLY